MSRLFNKLPYVFEGSQETIAFQNGIQSEHDILNNKLKDLHNQLFVNSSDWSLPMWENMLGIVNKTDNIQARRENILAMLRATGVTTPKVLKDVCTSYSNGKVEVIEDIENYSFIIKFVDEEGIPSNLQGLNDTINTIKPAHLSFTYQFLYNIWQEYLKTTWGKVKEKTWNDVRSGTEVGDDRVQAICGAFLVGEVLCGEL